MTTDAQPAQAESYDERTVLGLFSAIPDGIMVLDGAGIVLYANDRAQQMFGGRELLGESLGLPLTLGRQAAEIEYIDGGGRIGFAEMRSAKFDWLGKPAVAVSLRDTTARRAMMDELALDALLFESIQDGIMVTRPDGVVIRVNKAFEVITGYAADEVLGQTLRLLKSDQQDSTFYERMWASIAESGSWRGEIVNRHKDGSLYSESISISKVHDTDGVFTHLVGVFADQSQRRAAQVALDEAEAHKQLLPLEKMAAIGQLAAGVAQELHHPVDFVLSNLGVLGEYANDLLRLVDAYEAGDAGSSDVRSAQEVGRVKTEIGYTALREDLMRRLDQSQDGLERIRRIVSDLKNSARPGDPD